jgi:hypothetical protein
MVLDQLRGFVGNVRESLGMASWEGFLPPSIVSTLKFLGEAVPDAFGFDTPYAQIRGSVVLGILAVLSSVLTLGATLVFVGVFAVTGFVGIVRHIPIVEEVWPLPEAEVLD